jgi:phage shock protein PspC (stress-responsive transcriptional regulator)/uncharacterized membrane protein
MNKTITMNLSGIIFYIEEDAYDQLNNYLKAIKSYFHSSDSKEEILNDIEARIAEMLQSRVNKSKQAVVISDVAFVIESMGKPEEFGYEAEKENKQTNENKFSEKEYRRIFRDPDDKIVGGVCSGIANHFDFDPLWLRAGFAVSFFVFGSGFLLYLILMIIIPKAKTASEKLEMRGERIDINNIGKTINDEFDDLKDRVKDLGAEIKSPKNKEELKRSGKRISSAIGNAILSIIRFIAKAFALFITTIAIALLIGYSLALFGVGGASFSSGFNEVKFTLIEFLHTIIPDQVPFQTTVLSLSVFIIIPLLAIIIHGLKFLLGIKKSNNIIKYSASIIWFIALIMLVFVGFRTGLDFSEEVIIKQKTITDTVTSNLLNVDILNMENTDALSSEYHHKSKIYFGDWEIISQNDSSIYIGYPTLKIIKSDNENFELNVIKSAAGVSKKEAAQRAQQISYTLLQKDSTLFLDNVFSIKKTDKIRSQTVQVILKVPVNKSVFLSPSLEDMIFDTENIQGVYDNDMANKKWTMTSNGLTLDKEY